MNRLGHNHHFLQCAGIISLILLAFMLCPVPRAQAQHYQAFSNSLPPWTIDAETGIFPELVREIQKRMDHWEPITILPWSRAQHYAKIKSHTLVFPLSRIPAREADYKWIIDVWPLRLAFGGVGTPPMSLEEARLLGSIAVHQDSPPHIYLKQLGFDNFIPIPPSSGDIPRMLLEGRVDTWFAAVDLIEYGMEGTPLEGKLQYSPVLISKRLYIAASKDFPDDLTQQFRSLFEEIKADGTFEKIIAKHIRAEVRP